MDEEMDVHQGEIKLTTPEDPKLYAPGVDGCTIVYIWTSNPKQLICVHALAGDDNLRLQARLAGNLILDSTITHIEILAPNDKDYSTMKDEFRRLFPRAYPRKQLYAYDNTRAHPDESDEWWDMEANIHSPGTVKVTHKKE